MAKRYVLAGQCNKRIVAASGGFQGIACDGLPVRADPTCILPGASSTL